MKKRQNRLPPIEHEQQQIEALKGMTPNTTPAQYRTLSDGLADVSIQALVLIAALETNRRPNFERLYDLVDRLADLVGESDEANAIPVEHDTKSLVDNSAGTIQAPRGTAQPTTPLPIKQPITGVSAVKSTIVGRPERIVVDNETVTLYLTYTPQPNANGQYSFPKGVPAPQAIPTPIVAYIGKKQFDKIKLQLDDPEDTLIIEGGVSQIIDGVLNVYANNITSRVLQMAKIDQQKAAAHLIDSTSRVVK